jgi:hypothetical protein
MEIDANIEQVKLDVARQIQRMKDGRINDKRKSAFVAIYTGVVSSITTICIGIVSFIPESYSNIFGLISLLTSASLTVVIAWDSIFQHKKLWVNTATALNEFYELDTDIRHLEANPNGITQTLTNQIYERYKKILKDNNDRWKNIRE